MAIIQSSVSSDSLIIDPISKAARVTLYDINGDPVSISVSGSVSVSNFPATQPISAISLPLPSGASTSALQSTGNTSLASLDSKTVAVNTGAVTISSALPAGSNVIGHVITDSGSTTAVSNFPATQTVTGTVSANQSGSWNVSTIQLSNIDAGNSSTTPLAGNATFTGTGIDTSNYSVITVFVFTDQTGTLNLQFSTNNTNWDNTLAYSILANTSQHIQIGPQSRYFRVTYTNGNNAQSTFRLQTIEKPNTSFFPTATVSALVDPNADSILTKSVISGKTTAGGGSYVDVKVNPSGNLTVDASSTTTLPLPTGASTNTGEDSTNGLKAVAIKPLSTSTYSPSIFTNFGANATLNVKASAGNVFSLLCQNLNTAMRWLQLHNTATTPAGGATPIVSIPVPGSTTAIIGTDYFTLGGFNFSTGIAFAFSTTSGTYTAGAAADQMTQITYK